MKNEIILLYKLNIGRKIKVNRYSIPIIDVKYSKNILNTIE